MSEDYIFNTIEAILNEKSQDKEPRCVTLPELMRSIEADVKFIIGRRDINKVPLLFIPENE